MGLLDDLKLEYKMGGVTQRLIFWNVGVFLLSLALFFSFRFGVFDYPEWLALSSNPKVVAIHPWTLVTYSFFHAGLMHLIFNMLVLNFAGSLFLTFFRPAQLFGVYILSAVFAGAVFVGVYAALGRFSPIVGASASIMGLLMAATTYSPNMEIRLLLIGRVRLWHLTAVLLLIDLMQLLIENTGGHIAHLAGALFGFLFVRLLQQGIDVSRPVAAVSDFVMGLFQPKPKTPFRKVHRNTHAKPQQARVVRQPSKDQRQQQIDEILDKISQSGYDSLTQAEKDFLFKAGK